LEFVPLFARGENQRHRRCLAPGERVHEFQIL